MDRAPLLGLFGIFLMILALVAQQKPETGKPWAEVSAVPRITQDRTVVTVTLRLHGEEREEFYCPAVEWTWADGTRSREESDCEPWPERTGYPRVWSRRVLVIGPGEHRIEARLLRAGKLLMKAEGAVLVAGL